MSDQIETSSDTLTIQRAGTKLFAALAKTQGAIKAATKSQENTHFSKANKKATYADIADVIEVIQGPASANGLSVFFDYKSEGTDTFIRYFICHESGDFMFGNWVLMLMRDKTMHGFGAANTYYRRQLLKGIYQIPEDDDDGNSQSTPKEPEKEKPKSKNYAPSSDTRASIDAEEFDQYMQHGPPEEPPITLLDELRSLVDSKGIPHEEVKGLIKRATGRAAMSKDLTEQELRTVITYIKMKGF